MFFRIKFIPLDRSALFTLTKDDGDNCNNSLNAINSSNAALTITRFDIWCVSASLKFGNPVIKSVFE